eukprot:148437-Prymnesium_polylepis.1
MPTTCTHISEGLEVTDGRSCTGFTVVPWAERASGTPSPVSVRARAWGTHHHNMCMHMHMHNMTCTT